MCILFNVMQIAEYKKDNFCSKEVASSQLSQGQEVFALNSLYLFKYLFHFNF
jgi:hypothetical protein